VNSVYARSIPRCAPTDPIAFVLTKAICSSLVTAMDFLDQLHSVEQWQPDANA
jgi:hypothetical protein